MLTVTAMLVIFVAMAASGYVAATAPRTLVLTTEDAQVRRRRRGH